MSGNIIDISAGGEAAPEAAGGGIFADNVRPKYAEGARVVASTIANNQLSIVEGGNPRGAGLFLEGLPPESPGDEYALGVFDTSIVGNTSSLNGVANGGQVWLDAKYLEIINTLISGNEAQGDDDLYVSYSEVNGSGSAVFHGDVPPDQGFLPGVLADPANLGPLQFNGSALLDDDQPKYGLFGAVKTIALLEGSGAIDPTITTEITPDECATEPTGFPDQRGYPRDPCSDIGAYEWSAERDGDELEMVRSLRFPLQTRRSFSEDSNIVRLRARISLHRTMAIAMVSLTLTRTVWRASAPTPVNTPWRWLMRKATLLVPTVTPSLVSLHFPPWPNLFK